MIGLARLTGIEARILRDVFDRMNVFPRWLGPSGKGDWWDPTEARRIVRVLRKRGFFGSEDYPRRRVILLGKRVMRAFDLDRDYFDPVTINGTEHVVAPHFSGVNRWWNDGHNRKVAEQAWLYWIREAGES
ncbi:hypothetical protein [Caudoviricetes sp.]|nr:hypothetical protein [Caudoviricetes sp.]UOF82775.1 hypothetical protein [Caudoviricetes sp.]